MATSFRDRALRSLSKSSVLALCSIFMHLNVFLHMGEKMFSGKSCLWMHLCFVRHVHCHINMHTQKTSGHTLKRERFSKECSSDDYHMQHNVILKHRQGGRTSEHQYLSVLLRKWYCPIGTSWMKERRKGEKTD